MMVSGAYWIKIIKIDFTSYVLNGVEILKLHMWLVFLVGSAVCLVPIMYGGMMAHVYFLTFYFSN